MPEVDATLETPASTEVEQPDTTQAVEAEVGTETQVQPEPVVPEPKLLAGKYKTVEELEEGYRNTAAESSRMAQQLAAASKPAPVTEEPKYTVDQLETWKEGRLLEISQAQYAAQKAFADGDVARGQQYDAQARESAKQIRLIDTELRKMDIHATLQSGSKQAAEGKLLNEAVTVLKQYQGDLVEGTPLHTKASEFMEGYKAMGMDVMSPLVQAQAVSMAAQILGLSSRQVERTTRKELTQNINQALRQGVVTGGGKAGKSGSAAADFMKMTDAEFVAYKAQRGWD